MKPWNRLGQRVRDLGLLLSGRAPGQLIIQYSDACNAHCPQCELRCTVPLRRAKIDGDRVRAMIDRAAAQGVQALSFTGGEPLLFADELVELIDYAGRAGIRYIRTGTNGFVFRGSDEPDWEGRIRRLAEKLAGTDLYTFWISIDSADPTVHEQMRGLPGVIRGIARALPILHEYGIYPAANLGINRNTGGPVPDDDGTTWSRAESYDHFRTAFARFYEFVIGLGFTITNACYPMSIEPDAANNLDTVYGASSSDRIVRFSDDEKAGLFEALLDTIGVYRGQIRIFTPQCSLYALKEHYGAGRLAGYPCRGGVDYFFVDAQTVEAYACGFRGNESFGPYEQFGADTGDTEAFCRKCDWECFRDPSDLLGPLFELRRAPGRLWRRWRQEPAYFRYWRGDLAYYAACGFFCGRAAPDRRKLRRYGRASSNTPAPAGPPSGWDDPAAAHPGEPMLSGRT